jgi:hypothetical protein
MLYTAGASWARDDDRAEYLRIRGAPAIEYDQGIHSAKVGAERIVV